MIEVSKGLTASCLQYGVSTLYHHHVGISFCFFRFCHTDLSVTFIFYDLEATA